MMQHLQYILAVSSLCHLWTNTLPESSSLHTSRQQHTNLSLSLSHIMHVLRFPLSGSRPCARDAIWRCISARVDYAALRCVLRGLHAK